MTAEQEHYFFDVQFGEAITPDVHGIVLPSAEEAARDAVAIAAAMMSNAPATDQPVFVTVRSGETTVLRVRGVITMEHVGRDG